MNSTPLRPPISVPHRRLRPSLPHPTQAITLVGLALLALSCGTLNRTVVAPPEIPGATYIGNAGCADCHEEIVRDFPTATHARIQAKGPNASEIGCESCHGAGSLHSDSGGNLEKILHPGKSPGICLNCHLDVRADFSLPHRHPMGNNRLGCADCHESHKGAAKPGGATAFLSENQACLECHTSQRGPHVFEHEALREGCTTCHRPHGSVNAKLLTERNAVLCLKCHFQQQTAGGQVVIGGFNHTTLLPQGTCWSSGCHEAVHGSQVNSSLRY